MEEQKIIVLEANPTDARLKIAPDGIVQTLKSRMGTGGGNVPLLMIRRNTSGSENSKE